MVERGNIMQLEPMAIIAPGIMLFGVTNLPLITQGIRTEDKTGGFLKLKIRIINTNSIPL